MTPLRFDLKFILAIELDIRLLLIKMCSLSHGEKTSSFISPQKNQHQRFINGHWDIREFSFISRATVWTKYDEISTERNSMSFEW